MVVAASFESCLVRAASEPGLLIPIWLATRQSAATSTQSQWAYWLAATPRMPLRHHGSEDVVPTCQWGRRGAAAAQRTYVLQWLIICTRTVLVALRPVPSPHELGVVACLHAYRVDGEYCSLAARASPIRTLLQLSPLRGLASNGLWKCPLCDMRVGRIRLLVGRRVDWGSHSAVVST